MKKRNASAWREYPTPLRTRVGCKVSWKVYATIEEAKVCAAAAESNAVIQRSKGYDFGYCSPGSITPAPDGWEVCIP